MTQSLPGPSHSSPPAKDITGKNYTQAASLWVDTKLKRFIDEEVLPNTGIAPTKFWCDFSDVVDDFAPKNRSLLETRNELQKKIDAWHIAHRDKRFDPKAYRRFLQSIGYIAPAVEDFTLSTENVDDEVALQAGPQLVVPLKNARFALNAANARWGSLYDAIYGTDLIADASGLARGRSYNPTRGAEVIARGREFLDQAVPLAGGSHSTAKRYFVKDATLKVEREDGAVLDLHNSAQFLGYRGGASKPSAVLLVNNGLRVALHIDPSAEVGKLDKAGVCDIVMEAALTTIVDCEDSVAAVDAHDKLEVYRNWLGLVKGTLTAEFTKGKDRLVRSLNADHEYLDPHGNSFSLPGRSLLFIRNVGHLMTNPAILHHQHCEVPEGIMDAVITSLIALHDIKFCGPFENSRKKSIYIVKPKMHGPQEVAFTNLLFERVEKMLELNKATIKLGIMDEERRTTINLKSCIKEARDRCVFINTGFLDRTGDEIHTSMQAGPMVPKAQMKQQAWIRAYEQANVDTGLACGFRGRAQIGKGMWPMPDMMAKMLEDKIVHPQAGATTAWVPSPTAAVIHALHYHRVCVPKVQVQLEQGLNRDTEECFDALLEIPLIADRNALSPDIIREEIDNNCQGILGYVVRWIDQGIGCSKVLDINNIGLMEDRATLRISSQLLANWLLHDMCNRNDIEQALRRMANIVDKQNLDDPDYEPMSDNFDTSVAFQAARALIFQGHLQANGYTEPLLHAYRLEKKGHDMRLGQAREQAQREPENSNIPTT